MQHETCILNVLPNQESSANARIDAVRLIAICVAVFGLAYCLRSQIVYLSASTATKYRA